jgi:hypothetical protein
VLDRYPSRHVMNSPRDPLFELLVHLEYLRSQDYVVELLTKSHGATANDASKRARSIASHAQAAYVYAIHSAGSNDETAFLTGYYAILNILKLYILFSTRHRELAANRWHGASYDVYGKESRSLLTEVVTLRRGGTISLVYELLTGARITDRTTIQLRDVYAFIRGISAEWTMTGNRFRLAQLIWRVEQGAGVRNAIIDVQTGTQGGSVSKREVKALTTCTRSQTNRKQFLGVQTADANIPEEALVRACVRPALLYSDLTGNPLTPLSSRSLLLPQEMPIALAFFHLSSVVRYKPEFIARLRDSRYWPVVTNTRYHGMLHFLRLLWSYVHQRELFIETR